MNIFVPGRLCLFGEHSDWAGLYNRTNSQILPGTAIVSGIEQGIYAYCERAKTLRFRALNPDNTHGEWMEWPLDAKALKAEAREGGFYSYIIGVAAFMLEHYDVGGISIDITKITLPMKKGLSSSAAICVLVARAYNILYELQISVRGEMEAAYRGEIMTPSRCGRLDQACAYGIKPIIMQFESENIDVSRLPIGSDLHWVFADLNGKKDTMRILSALNACYPFAQTDIAVKVQEALGSDNQRIIQAVIHAMKAGDAKRIGELMDESQRIFDEKIAPACPQELASPLLHKVMEDPTVRSLSLGVKGVGSHGDGTVQMICEDAEKQQALCAYLQTCGMEASTFTIHTQRSVRKAIIPVAGYGTRMFPATKVIKKELLPVVDTDGIAKPALLMLLQELDKAGIEETALVINPGDQAIFDQLFKRDITADHFHKLPLELREMNVELQRLGQKITYVYQNEPLGFGHAVYQARDFAGNEPVLMMLGDHLYSTANNRSCAAQIIEAYERTNLVTISLDEVTLDQVMHYGTVTGRFLDEEERFMQVTDIVEKPTADYAYSHMRVSDQKGKDRYFCVFGQYILTPKVFELLAKRLDAPSASGEIGVTEILKDICKTEGITGYRTDGQRFDIGIPRAYQKTVSEFPNAGATKIYIRR